MKIFKKQPKKNIIRLIQDFYLIAISIFFVLFFGGVVLALGTQNTGHRTDPGNNFQINYYSGTCQDVDHGAGSAYSYFIPTKTAAEWYSFIKAHPRLDQVDLSHCSAGSEFNYCTNTFTQNSCAANTRNITITWTFSSAVSDYCDCDGLPDANDCACWCSPSCAAADQEFIFIEIDNNGDFSSPEVVIDQAVIGNAATSYTFNTTAMPAAGTYYWRINIIVKIGANNGWMSGSWTSPPQSPPSVVLAGC